MNGEWPHFYAGLAFGSTNSPLDSKNLQVMALYIPAEIAAKMKREAENFKRDSKPK
jgi:hypothetical protein